MPTIDVQCHTIATPVWAGIKKVAESVAESSAVSRARQMARFPMIAEDPQMVAGLDERILILDEAGIDVQVISQSVCNANFFQDAQQNADLSRAANDEFSEACQRHPDRYRFFAHLPMPHARQSVDELKRAAALPGFAGVVVYAELGVPLDDPSLMDLYQEMNDMRTLMFIHPNYAIEPGRYARLGLESAVGWPAMDTLAVMELILGGVCDRFPDITVITPHLGGTMLYLIGRIDNHCQRRHTEELPSWYMKRMYHDSVCFQHSALELARTMVGSDHILFASDFPWQCRNRLAEAVEVIDTLDWPADELANVRGGTMERLLRERGYW